MQQQHNLHMGTATKHVSAHVQVHVAAASRSNSSCLNSAASIPLFTLHSSCINCRALSISSSVYIIVYRWLLEVGNTMGKAVESGTTYTEQIELQMKTGLIAVAAVSQTDIVAPLEMAWTTWVNHVVIV